MVRSPHRGRPLLTGHLRRMTTWFGLHIGNALPGPIRWETYTVVLISMLYLYLVKFKTLQQA
jgi:hypothetical protein